MANVVEVTPTYVGYQKQATGTKKQILTKDIVDIQPVTKDPKGNTASLVKVVVGRNKGKGQEYYITETASALATLVNA